MARNYLADHSNDADAALRGIEVALIAAADEARKGTLPESSNAAIHHTLQTVIALHGERQLADARVERG